MQETVGLHSMHRAQHILRLPQMMLGRSCGAGGLCNLRGRHVILGLSGAGFAGTSDSYPRLPYQ